MDNEVIPQFPPPPAFYKRFKRDASGVAPPPPPPSVPESGEYLLFGETRKLEERTQTLESEGLRTLFNPEADDAKLELAALVTGSKQKFKKILGHLADNAEQTLVDDALKEFHLQLVNMMYLVNEMRQHEAKDEVLQLLRDQIRFKRSAIARLKQSLANAERELATAFQDLASTSELPAQEQQDEKPPSSPNNSNSITRLNLDAEIACFTPAM